LTLLAVLQTLALLFVLLRRFSKIKDKEGFFLGSLPISWSHAIRNSTITPQINAFITYSLGGLGLLLTSPRLVMRFLEAPHLVENGTRYRPEEESPGIVAMHVHAWVKS